MAQSAHTVSLGFTGQQFEPGVHICQIFSDDDERQEALLQYMLTGLQGGERTACFTEQLGEESLREFLGAYGISYDEQKAKGSINLARTRDVYFLEDRFDPERMLSLLRNFYTSSMAEGYSAARVIGEMTPRVQHVPGGSRLLEYESRVSMLLRECPVTAVCQYDARVFDGATIMDVLKVHPLMIVRGSVVHNQFYIPPEDYLKGLRAD